MRSQCRWRRAPTWARGRDEDVVVVATGTQASTATHDEVPTSAAPCTQRNEHVALSPRRHHATPPNLRAGYTRCRRTHVGTATRRSRHPRCLRAAYTRCRRTHGGRRREDRDTADACAPVTPNTDPPTWVRRREDRDTTDACAPVTPDPAAPMGDGPWLATP
jgi:hypothetical protein